MALLYAHRGAVAERPENTLPSFRRALELGAGALEMDVHMTRDGEVVVSHDPSGARMAGVPKMIRECTWCEVQNWDAGIGFRADDGSRPWAGRGVTMPRFSDVLDEFRDVPLNVDIKQTGPAMVDAVVDVIRTRDAESQVTLGSFHEATVVALRRRQYGGPIALTRAEILGLHLLPASMLRRLVRGNAAQIPTRAGPLDLATESLIERCHALGIRVDYWTINDPAQAKQLLDLGADGIMTDDPGVIAPLFSNASPW